MYKNGLFFASLLGTLLSADQINILSAQTDSIDSTSSSGYHGDIESLHNHKKTQRAKSKKIHEQRRLKKTSSSMPSGHVMKPLDSVEVNLNTLDQKLQTFSKTHQKPKSVSSQFIQGAAKVTLSKMGVEAIGEYISQQRKDYDKSFHEFLKDWKKFYAVVQHHAYVDWNRKNTLEQLKDFNRMLIAQAGTDEHLSYSDSSQDFSEKRAAIIHLFDRFVVYAISNKAMIAYIKSQFPYYNEKIWDDQKIEEAIQLFFAEIFKDQQNESQKRSYIEFPIFPETHVEAQYRAWQYILNKLLEEALVWEEKKDSHDLEYQQKKATIEKFKEIVQKIIHAPYAEARETQLYSFSPSFMETGKYPDDAHAQDVLNLLQNTYPALVFYFKKQPSVFNETTAAFTRDRLQNQIISLDDAYQIALSILVNETLHGNLKWLFEGIGPLFTEQDLINFAQGEEKTNLLDAYEEALQGKYGVEIDQQNERYRQRSSQTEIDPDFIYEAEVSSQEEPHLNKADPGSAINFISQEDFKDAQYILGSLPENPPTYYSHKNGQDDEATIPSDAIANVSDQQSSLSFPASVQSLDQLTSQEINLLALSIIQKEIEELEVLFESSINNQETQKRLRKLIILIHNMDRENLDKKDQKIFIDTEQRLGTIIQKFNPLHSENAAKFQKTQHTQTEERLLEHDTHSETLSDLSDDTYSEIFDNDLDLNENLEETISQTYSPPMSVAFSSGIQENADQDLASPISSIHPFQAEEHQSSAEQSEQSHSTIIPSESQNFSEVQWPKFDMHSRILPAQLVMETAAPEIAKYLEDQQYTESYAAFNPKLKKFFQIIHKDNTARKKSRKAPQYMDIPLYKGNIDQNKSFQEFNRILGEYNRKAFAQMNRKDTQVRRLLNTMKKFNEIVLHGIEGKKISPQRESLPQNFERPTYSFAQKIRPPVKSRKINRKENNMVRSSPPQTPM